MTILENYYEQSQISLAAYATDLISGNRNDDAYMLFYINTLKDEGLTQTQAETFATRYTVLSSQQNTSSGFSATIFKDNETGKIIFSVRGIELTVDGFIDDLSTDLGDIGADGIAIAQSIDMFNYYQELNAITGEPILHYEYIEHRIENGELVKVEPYIKVTTASIATEDGVLALQNFDVTGHSLGGHLALALDRMASDSVNEVTTFNAPGFDSVVSGSESFYQLLHDAEVAEIGTSTINTTGYDEGSLSNITVEGDIISDIGTVPGTLPQIKIYSETQNEGPVDAHAMTDIMDSLSVYALLEKMDSSITIEDATRILNSASKENGNTLESIVESIYELIENPAIDLKINTRDELNIDINQIANSAFVDGTLTVIGLSVNETTESIALSAQSEVDYAYALKMLTSFRLIGDNAAAIYAQHNPNGELDLYNPDTGEGQLTENYLNDRAHFFIELMDVNVNDKILYTSDEPEYLKDITTGKVLATGYGTNFEGDVTNLKHTVFGSDGNDKFQGSDLNDRLYGGAGSDSGDLRLVA